MKDFNLIQNIFLKINKYSTNFIINANLLYSLYLNSTILIKKTYMYETIFAFATPLIMF